MDSGNPCSNQMLRRDLGVVGKREREKGKGRERERERKRDREGAERSAEVYQGVGRELDAAEALHDAGHAAQFTQQQPPLHSNATRKRCGAAR